MLNFLKSNGLKKINFIIINSANSSTYFDELRSNVNNSNVYIFQDTEQTKVWNLLNGKNYDIFVYNRCGSVTYHTPFPLSILDRIEPIVQATLIATYYEDLCNGCQLNNGEIQLNEHSKTAQFSVNKEVIESDKKNTSRLPIDYTSRTGREESTDYQKYDLINENQNEKKSKNETANIDKISTKGSKNDKESYLVKGEILKESNSTFNVSDIFNEKDEQQKAMKNNSYSFFSPWQLFKYFLLKSGNSFNTTRQLNLTNDQIKQSVHLESPNVDPIQNGMGLNNQSFVTSNLSNINESLIGASSISTTSIISTLSTNDSKIDKLSINLSNNSNLLNKESENSMTIKSSKCAAFPEGLNCAEYSFDKMLGVRLCCLNGNNILSSGMGFSCRKFNNTICATILPIIKCCLRDLSEVLDDYFNKNGNKNEP